MKIFHHLVTLASVATSALGAFNLTTQVTGASSSLTNADDFKVTVTIYNTGDENVTILNSPGSAVTSKYMTQIFDIVSDSNKTAEFKGATVKWNSSFAMASQDYITIPSGASFTIDHDLSGMYNFTNSGAGTYKIDGGRNFQVVLPTGEASLSYATTQPYMMQVSGKLAPTVARLAKRADYPGCNATQLAMISDAVAYANSAMLDAHKYLQGLATRTPRYIMWFGPWDAGRQSVVASHFEAIGGNATYTSYDCATCAGTPYANHFAYSFTNQSYIIYLCDGFWNSQTSGTNSRAGTLIHQLVSFNVFGGSRDYTTGHLNVQRFARTYPELGIYNSESYEYFAENTPPMN